MIKHLAEITKELMDFEKKNQLKHELSKFNVWRSNAEIKKKLEIMENQDTMMKHI